MEKARAGSVKPQMGMRLALSPAGAERGVESRKQGGAYLTAELSVYPVA